MDLLRSRSMIKQRDYRWCFWTQLSAEAILIIYKHYNTRCKDLYEKSILKPKEYRNDSAVTFSLLQSLIVVIQVLPSHDFRGRQHSTSRNKTCLKLLIFISSFAVFHKFLILPLQLGRKYFTPHQG